VARCASKKPRKVAVNHHHTYDMQDQPLLYHHTLLLLKSQLQGQVSCVSFIETKLSRPQTPVSAEADARHTL
jgi:hypothetical protein